MFVPLALYPPTLTPVPNPLICTPPCSSSFACGGHFRSRTMVSSPARRLRPPVLSRFHVAPCRPCLAYPPPPPHTVRRYTNLPTHAPYIHCGLTSQPMVPPWFFSRGSGMSNPERGWFPVTYPQHPAVFLAPVSSSFAVVFTATCTPFWRQTSTFLHKTQKVRKLWAKEWTFYWNLPVTVEKVGQTP